MRKIIVKVDKEKATELERVNFELNFVKDIVQRVIEITSKRFRTHQWRYSYVLQ